MESKKHTLIRSIPIFTLLTILIFLTGCISTTLDENNQVKVVKNVSMKIITPDWKISYMNITTSNVTVADFLYECADHHDFSIKSEYWQGYKSLFIEAINDFENGEDGRYWQYYVNNDFAHAGCSNYYLKNNDTVEWRFELSKW